MESLGAKLAVAGGSTAAVGGAGAGLYLTQGAEASAVETINEQSTLSKEEIKSSKIKDSTEKNTNKVPKEKVLPTKNINTRPTDRTTEAKIDSVLNRYWLYLLDAENPSNEHWWKEKHELYKKENNLDEKFREVTVPYSTEDDKALNKVCAKLYQETDPNFEENSADNQKAYTKKYKFKLKTSNLTNNLWKFCSLLDGRPQNLNEAGESQTSNGDIINNQVYYADYLIATETPNNSEFWNLKDKWFKSLEDSGEDKTKSEFLEYVKTKTGNESISQKPLKEICKSTYDQGHQNKDKEISLILTYCTYFEYPFKNWFYSLSHQQHK